MSLHAERTHPTPVDGCDACRYASLSWVLPSSFKTTDTYQRNKSRTDKILKDREEAREGLTDLRYGRRVDQVEESKILDRPNLDGIKPKRGKP